MGLVNGGRFADGYGATGTVLQLSADGREALVQFDPYPETGDPDVDAERGPDSPDSARRVRVGTAELNPI